MPIGVPTTVYQQMVASNVGNVVMTQPGVQAIQPRLQPHTTYSAQQSSVTNNLSVPGCPSLPASMPSPVTPTRKIYKQTFFHGDVTLVKEAMKKLTKHVNSVSSVRKINANVKFFSEFQFRVTIINRKFLSLRTERTLSRYCDPLKVVFDQNVDR